MTAPTATQPHIPVDAAGRVIVVSDGPTAFAGAPTLTNVASSASNVTLVAANPNRRGLIIYNESTAVLSIKFGATASATSYTQRLQPNTGYEMSAHTLYTGIIDGIWASANGSARITELV